MKNTPRPHWRASKEMQQRAHELRREMHVIARRIFSRRGNLIGIDRIYLEIATRPEGPACRMQGNGARNDGGSLIVSAPNG